MPKQSNGGKFLTLRTKGNLHSRLDAPSDDAVDIFDPLRRTSSDPAHVPICTDELSRHRILNDKFNIEGPLEFFEG